LIKPPAGNLCATVQDNTLYRKNLNRREHMAAAKTTAKKPAKAAKKPAKTAKKGCGCKK
jgi:hypothetical protein